MAPKSKKKLYTGGPTKAEKKLEYEISSDHLVIESDVRPTSEDMEMDIITKFSDRLSKMDSGRTQFEEDWDVCDGQMQANTYYDEQGRLNVNVPVEQSLVELACGRFAGKLNFKLEPVGRQPDVNEMQSAKYSLAFFMWKEKVHKTIKRLRWLRAQYGTAIVQTAITVRTEPVYSLNEKAEDENGIRATESAYDKTDVTEYFFGPKIIPLRHFRLDERAVNQPEIQEAEDCIVQESVSIEELKARRAGNKAMKNLDKITPMLDDERAIADNTTTYDNQVQVYYYYNRQTKDYWIISNKDTLHFKGYMVNKNKLLPVRSCQHYTDENCFYGRGICHKVRYSKAYKSEMFQAMLDQIGMTGSSILVGNDNDIAGHTFAGPSEMSIIRFTGALDKVQQVNFDPNIQKYQVILDYIDGLIIQDTGENLKATYEETAGQLGTVEIIEQNRLTRISTTDENDDTFVGELLTDMLDNITQYAPKLLKKTEKTKEGGVEKIIRPMIIIPDVEVGVRNEGEKNEKGEEKEEYEFLEDFGQYGYFELTDTLIKNQYLVQVITNSNMNVMKVLDKNSFTQYLQNRQLIIQGNPQIAQTFDGADEMSYMKILYDIDDKMVTDTKKSKTKKQNLALMQQITDFIGATTDDQTNQTAMGVKAQSDDPTNATGVFPDASGTTGGDIQAPGGIQA